MGRARYTVEVEWSRVQGKFASREEITDLIYEALTNAEGDCDITGIGADGESEYEVTSWDVTEA